MRFIIFLLPFLTITSCGVRGDLYLPEDAETTSKVQATADTRPAQ